MLFGEVHLPLAGSTFKRTFLGYLASFHIHPPDNLATVRSCGPKDFTSNGICYCILSRNLSLGGSILLFGLSYGSLDDIRWHNSFESVQFCLGMLETLLCFICPELLFSSLLFGLLLFGFCAIENRLRLCLKSPNSSTLRLVLLS